MSAPEPTTEALVSFLRAHADESKANRLGWTGRWFAEAADRLAELEALDPLLALLARMEGMERVALNVDHDAAYADTGQAWLASYDTDPDGRTDPTEGRGETPAEALAALVALIGEGERA